MGYEFGLEEERGALLGLAAPSTRDYAQVWASRVMYSRSCGFFYASLLAASITEIIWILHPWIDTRHCCHVEYPQSPLFFFVEAYLTVGLVAETSVRFLWQRDDFWASPGNVFDAGVCGLSVLSFLLYLRRSAQDVEVVVLVLMLTWLILRIARLLTVANKVRTHLVSQRSLQHLDIAFPEDGEDSDSLSPPPSPRV